MTDTLPIVERLREYLKNMTPTDNLHYFCANITLHEITQAADAIEALVKALEDARNRLELLGIYTKSVDAANATLYKVRAMK